MPRGLGMGAGEGSCNESEEDASGVSIFDYLEPHLVTVLLYYIIFLFHCISLTSECRERGWTSEIKDSNCQVEEGWEYSESGHCE